MHSVSDIARTIQGTIDGRSDLLVQDVCDLKNSRKNCICYLSPGVNEKFFHSSNCTVIIVDKNFDINRGNKTLIKVENPALSFIDIVHLFYPKDNKKNGIHKTAVIGENVTIGKNTSIGPFAVIDDYTDISNSVQIGANCYIGPKTIIGEGTIIRSNVSIYENIYIGANCIIDSGTTVGADGFGLITNKDNGKHYKVPHIGSVKIKNDVWIGANCCIDRGTFGDTIINKGSKLDNLIQIAHNVHIGENCRISGQTAIAGSTIIGDNVTIAGQVGIIDHLNIGNNTVIASKSAVFESLKDESFVSGIPAKNHKNRLRQEVVINQLPDLLNRIRTLESKISNTKENKIVK